MKEPNVFDATAFYESEARKINPHISLWGGHHGTVYLMRTESGHFHRIGYPGYYGRYEARRQKIWRSAWLELTTQ